MNHLQMYVYVDDQPYQQRRKAVDGTSLLLPGAHGANTCTRIPQGSTSYAGQRHQGEERLCQGQQ